MTVIWLHLATLPIGYAIVSRFYPEPTLPWKTFLQFAFLTLIWPVVVLVTLTDVD